MGFKPAGSLYVILMLLFIIFVYQFHQMLEVPSYYAIYKFQSLQDGRMTTYKPIDPWTHALMTYRKFIDLLADKSYNGQQFRIQLTNEMIKYRYDFDFECPGLTSEDYIYGGKVVEFTLIRRGKIDELFTDFDAFSKHFNHTTDNIAVFPSVSGEALYIAPKFAENQNPNTYASIANFLRYGSTSQISSFWKSTGYEMKRKLSTSALDSGSKLYLSTSDVGPRYVHVRLSGTPDYFKVIKYVAV